MQQITAAPAQVAQKQADLDYARCSSPTRTVAAPAAGIVSQARTSRSASSCRPGQPLLAIVEGQEVWVVANFKETQLRSMRVGPDGRDRGRRLPGARPSTAGSSPSRPRPARSSRCCRRTTPPATSPRSCSASPVKIVFDRAAGPRTSAARRHERQRHREPRLSETARDHAAWPMHRSQGAPDKWIITVTVILASMIELDRHLDRQRRAAADDGQPRRDARRDRLGRHRLHRRQRDRDPDDRLVRRPSSAGATTSPARSSSSPSPRSSAATPPSIWELVFFRFVQGAGGGALLSTSQAILVETFPPEELGLANGSSASASWSARPSARPSAAGSPTTTPGRWIFYVNLPIGVLAALLTSRPSSAIPKQKRELGAVDWCGDRSCSSLGIGSLQIVLERGERDDWFSSPLHHGAGGPSRGSGIVGFIWRELDGGASDRRPAGAEGPLARRRHALHLHPRLRALRARSSSSRCSRRTCSASPPCRPD